jgi:uncharacterized protein YgbK (DUF1537 family)
MAINTKCLVIADDLTGGSDTGAQFAKKGYTTQLISVTKILNENFSKYLDKDVLVLNTNTRGVDSKTASRLMFELFQNKYIKRIPIIYKKIDSTLRGNVGFEVDAIMQATGISLSFLCPSFPEQNRIMANGILLLNGKPLTLLKNSFNNSLPIKKSNVVELLKRQSSQNIGWIDLNLVAANKGILKSAVNREVAEQKRILIFDAVRSKDLRNIADVAFDLKQKLLLVGSAGLAKEVVGIMPPPKNKLSQKLSANTTKKRKHVLFICGSASSISHLQINRIQQNNTISTFELEPSLLQKEKKLIEAQEKTISSSLGNTLKNGNGILRVNSEKPSKNQTLVRSISRKIPSSLGRIVSMALEKSKLNVDDLLLILIGGETSCEVLRSMGFQGLHIEGEIIPGVPICRIIGGKWSRLLLITKAGSFGDESTFEEILKSIC